MPGSAPSNFVFVGGVTVTVCFGVPASGTLASLPSDTVSRTVEFRAPFGYVYRNSASLETYCAVDGPGVGQPVTVGVGGADAGEPEGAVVLVAAVVDPGVGDRGAVGEVEAELVAAEGEAGDRGVAHRPAAEGVAEVKDLRVGVHPADLVQGAPVAASVTVAGGDLVQITGAPPGVRLALVGVDLLEHEGGEAAVGQGAPVHVHLELVAGHRTRLWG